MILDKIARYTEERVRKLKKNKPLPELIGQLEQTAGSWGAEPFSFEKALKKKEIAFICEIKKASPSKGIISEEFPYLAIAEEYRDARADALSVLTEPGFFLGSDDYLAEIRSRVDIPILRKDFILDSYQIYESKLIGADAILLICALLPLSRLKEYIALADSLELSSVVEAHTESEIFMAIEAGARVIGINNRDLKSFVVDLNTTKRLRPLISAGITVISESGIETPEDIKLLKDCGIDAVLIGETLMRSGSKFETLEKLREGAAGNGGGGHD